MRYGIEELTGNGKKTKLGKQGEWLFKDQDGRVRVIAHYLNNQKHGSYFTFYPNGQIEMDGQHENGVHSGEWKDYYENGQIKQEAHYIGKEFFPTNFWLENGAQLLINGTGKTIEAFGESGHEVVEFHFLNGVFVKEVKLTDVRYGNFIPKDDI